MGSFARTGGARAALAFVAGTLALGCGSNGGGSGFSPDAGGDGACATCGDDGAIPDGGGPPDVGFGDDSATQQLGCSGDLQNVVDMNGHVVMQCPSDQGCSGGKCVPACQAAADSHGSIGCDYVLATPDFEMGHAPPCFVVFVANSWTRPVKIGVSRAGTSYDVTTFGRIPTVGTPTTSWSTVPATGLPPNQVAVLFMSSDPNATNLSPINCPVPDAINMETAVFSGQETTGLGEAFHITTDTPVNGYDVIPYGGAKSYLPSAELLLPTSAWGTNYVMVLPRPGNSGEMWGQIVAAQDNTTVKIVPTQNLPAGNGVAAAPMGMVTSYTLKAGQYIQWQMPGFQMGNDFSGTIVSSNNPVGVNGGNGILCLKSMTSPTGGGCDSEHELVPPVSALGSEYVAAPTKSRAASGQPESLPYRIVGTVTGTTLTFDPPVTGAPATLDVAQVADFEATGAFRVASQDAKHPFYLAQMIPGCMVTGGDVLNSVDPSAPFASANCLGDEDYTTVIPPAQWLQKYVFFTDPTYATTNVVLVRQKTMAGFEDVTVDCVGKVGGWQNVGASGNYEATNVDFIRGTKPVGNCNNGPHVAQSNGPFALVVWGLDSYSSYGYPAGGNYKTINSVVVPLPQ